MLNNSSKQSSQSTKNLVEETITDPWENTNNISAAKTEGWQAPVDIHPLICGEDNPELIGLPQSEASKINPMQVLIEDGLKIKAYGNVRLKEQLKEALGLLSWMLNVPSEYISQAEV
ncbi:MAG: hypothetical protein SWZ49_23095 [Cyanobacteriota bacterium]|nr:hypothetical protein [Cyanobacteriota bacterium]